MGHSSRKRRATKADRGRSYTPFFEAPDLVSERPRRLLLITFHFPPSARIGALRWQKLSGFAAERGWTVDVIMSDPSSLESIDRTPLVELPPGTRVYGARMPMSFLERTEERLRKCFRWLRRKGTVPDVGNLVPASTGNHRGGAGGASIERSKRPLGRFVDLVQYLKGNLRRAYYAWLDYDTHGSWADEVTRIGAYLLERVQYDLIVTSGPPHMAHEAGRRLAKRSRLPLVIDLRDAWSLQQRLSEGIDSLLWYVLASKYERRVMSVASLVVMNTSRARDFMQNAYPEKRNQIVAVMNGYDDDVLRSGSEKREFIIAYVGTMYLDRNPMQLLEAVAQIITVMQLRPGEVTLEFIGDIDNYSSEGLTQFAKDLGIEDYVRLVGGKPRAAALDLMSRASVLVSLPLFRGRQANGRRMRPLQLEGDMSIPAKIYEYIQFDAWLLIVAQIGSAVEILFRNSAASVVAPDNVQGIADVLTTRIQQFRSGERPVRLSSQMSFASRREQAKLLLDAIEGLT